MGFVKLYVDDLRPTPDKFTHRAYSVNEAIRMIEEFEKNGDVIELISLDHDAGAYYSDGGDFIKILDYLVEKGKFYPVTFHTANPVGRENMRRMVDRYWP